MDAEKREKVIRGLECHATKGFVACQDCPYYPDELIYEDDDDMEGTICEEKLASDAIALLKGEEARVMTLKEARDALRTADFLYCEDKNDDTMAGGLTRGVLNGSDYWDLSNGEYMTPDCLDEGEDLEAEYGKTFRFWTSRPTPDQMRDTKWEKDNG